MSATATDFEGHRSEVISGKISPELYNTISGLVENGKYETKNDIVEEALIQFVLNLKAEKTEEGC